LRGGKLSSAKLLKRKGNHGERKKNKGKPLPLTREKVLLQVSRGKKSHGKIKATSAEENGKEKFSPRGTPRPLKTKGKRGKIQREADLFLYLVIRGKKTGLA